MNKDISMNYRNGNTTDSLPRQMKCLASVLLTLFLLTFRAAADDQAKSKGWRSAWIGTKNLDTVLKAAKELEFNAVIAHGNGGTLKEFIGKAKAAGLESYWWFSPVAPTGAVGSFRQQMSAAEMDILRKQSDLAKAKKLWGIGRYQCGGEPLPGTKEVLKNQMPCFHRPEVVSATKAAVSKVLEENPELTGIALDMFGYQNYSGCVCPASLSALEAYRASHPGTDNKKLKDEFYLNSLVSFQNEICNHARTIRPDVKTTVHVWPTFLPEPVYGNRLDLDYCCQTVAWFFKPYWSDAKIAEYTRVVVREARKYNKRQKGIPFIGYNKDKGVERLVHELRIIMANNPDRDLSIYVFEDVVNDPKALAAVRKFLLNQ